MSDMKISNDEPISPKRPSSTEGSVMGSSQINPSLKDTVSKSSSTNEKLQAQKTGSEPPELEDPAEDYISIADLLNAIGNATKEFRQQLQVSRYVDLDTQAKSTTATAAKSQELAILIGKKDLTVEDIEVMTNEATEELNDLIAAGNDAAYYIMSWATSINSGNAAELQAFKDLLAAYNQYIANLESIGAVKQSDGSYSIPNDQIEAYNTYTAEYQKAVNNFNTYWDSRSAQIEEYNNQVDIYNEIAKDINSALDDFANTYDLDPFPEFIMAEQRDISAYGEDIKAPPLLTIPPESEADGTTNVKVPQLPSYVSDMAASGPPVIASVGILNIPNAWAYYPAIYDSLYTTNVLELDESIQQASREWSYMLSQNAYRRKRLEENPFLTNDRLLYSELLSQLQNESFKRRELDVEVEKILKEKEFFAQMVDPQSQKILGFNMVQELLSTKDRRLNEVQVKQMTDQLITLSLATLSDSGKRALFPSLAPLSEILASLPQDSPAFGLLFATSLINRITENTTAGSSLITIKKIAENAPEFSALSEKDKVAIAASLDIGLLLMGGKLLESTLGMPGLMNQLVNTIADEAGMQTEVIKSPDDNSLPKLTEQFIAKGYLAEEANFLGTLSLELIKNGPQAPNVTIVSAGSVNKPLLIDSLKAALILSKDHLTLAQADAIAHQAVNDTFSENSRQPIKQFRASLELNLQELGIEKSRAEIVQKTVILPLDESSTTPLSKENLPTSIENRLLQLLVPQLGTELASNITKEVNLTLFGNQKMDISLITTAKETLKSLKFEQQEVFNEKMLEAFRATIETSIDLNAFLMKIMDPAYLLIYSAHAGIMYPSLTKEKPLMI